MDFDKTFYRFNGACMKAYAKIDWKFKNPNLAQHNLDFYAQISTMLENNHSVEQIGLYTLSVIESIEAILPQIKNADDQSECAVSAVREKINFFIDSGMGFEELMENAMVLGVKEKLSILLEKDNLKNSITAPDPQQSIGIKETPANKI